MLNARLRLTGALVLFFCTCVTAGAQRAPARAPGNGQIEIAIDGGPFHAETFTLQQTDGDWFRAPNDAHASLTFTGSQKGSPVQLALQWDGPGDTHTIDAEHNSDAGGEHVTFLLTMSGTAPYNLTAQPQNDDLVTIRVSKLDEMDLQASIFGLVTSSGADEADRRSAALMLKGTMTLHRSKAPVRPTTGTYTGCDNVIYDKLVGAQDRSPSECEVKFDADVRQTLSKAFEKVAAAFGTSPWQVEGQGEVDLAGGIARGSEKTLFQIDPYRIDARMDPASAQYQVYRTRYEDLSAKLRAEIAASLGSNGPAYQAILKLVDEANGATRVGVMVSINQASGGFVNFTGEHRVLQVPGAAYAIAASRVQAPTGGGIDDAIGNVSYVYLGNWKPATFEKLGGGGERMRLTAPLDPAAPHLSIQNIVIRIECNPALTETILKQIDFPALQKLLPR